MKATTTLSPSSRQGRGRERPAGQSVFTFLVLHFYVLKCLYLLGGSGQPLSIPRYNNLEHRALRLIASAGDQGILQSDLWRRLEASSREGSRIAIKLNKKGLIRRERELWKGRWTYRLYPKRRPASIDSILGCPCLTCPDVSRCGAWSAVSPNECDKLTAWIIALGTGGSEPTG